MNAFKKAVKQRGLWATIKQAQNLGISFEDFYVGIFSRFPRK